jgi:prepilin-type processing-associated H-X9-DG protein
MDKDNDCKDEEDVEDYDNVFDAPTSQWSGLKILLMILGTFVLSCGALAFLAPIMTTSRTPANKQKCANNLKGIGLAMILYSNDYRFFPHMQSLNAPNKSSDVAKVYRTLIYFKYIDNSEAYICPSSEDFYIERSDAVLNVPKQFAWKSATASGSNTKPVHSGPDPDLFTDPKFTELSYTYLRRKVNSTAARSDTMIAADKAIKDDFDSAASSPISGPVGNHSEGFNILYGDGHVNFVSSSETAIMTRMVKRLHMGYFDPTTIGGK